MQNLREVLQFRKKVSNGGGDSDMTKQLLILKEENMKLKEIAMNADMVEKLKLENKLMKLELQKMQNGGSSRGSNRM